jgi:hypothetical protein
MYHTANQFIGLAKNKMLKCTSVHFYTMLYATVCTFMLLEEVFQFQCMVYENHIN